ncbi:MAG: Ig-like domain-containing protein, partial [Phycisphaerae bacterium]|nr:Ig-like domain-containing protein [Saprospiraceae bacterium]
MTNRLHKFLRATPFCVGLCLFLLPTSWLKAQPDFFNFSYNGPTTLSVDATCNSMLQGNVPDPVVTSTMGFPITMSMFDAAASGFPYNYTFIAGDLAHVYWFVKDNMGHSYTYEYFINFVDNTPPTFNLTGVLDTLEFSSSAQVPPQTALPMLDNCTGVLKDTFYQTTPPPLCQSGTFTRTWKATDLNSNTAVFTQTIIIYKDTLPPQITGYPLSGSASCKQLATAYPAWRALQIATFAATDASGVNSLINNAPVSFPPGCKVPLTVKFWAIDNCMIQQIVSVTFSTSDLEGPVIVKPPKDTVAYCSQSDNELTKLREWISTKAYSQAFDSCSFPLTYIMKIGGVTKDSAQVVAAFLASFAGGCSTQTVGNQMFSKVHGLVSVDLSVKDACGNETLMGNVDFGARDTLRPVITGFNMEEQCGGGNDQTALQSWINAHGNATVVDDCSNFTWTNFTFTTSNGQSGAGNFNAGPYPTVLANNCTWFTDVTFRATDDCGNSNTVTLRWSIIDTQAPTFTGLQPSITVYCPNPLPTIPAATVSDNCDANVNVTFSRVFKDSLCDGSYTVLTTWTATDDCGRTASATQNIFVSDTTRPVFTLVPANKTFRCDTFVLPPVPVMGLNIMATDICSPVVSISTATNSFQNPDPASCGHYTYNIVRTFTASDECGNTRTATQTISVIDNLGPVPGGILDTTALCSALAPFPAPVPIATDACSGLTATPTKTGQTIMPGLCTGQYTITVHWSASDACGNSTTFNQIVHVIDTVPPTLVNIPANITVECDAIPAAPNNNTFNAADNCDNAVTVNLVQSEIRNPDTTACDHWTNYTVKRVWTATDNCGNTRSYTQLIQIEDTTPPTIVPPSAMMFSNDLGDCGADVTIPGPLSATDICSEQATNVMIMDMKPMVKSGPGPNSTTPVATMTFQLTSPNLPPFQPVAGGVVLKIILENADAEDTSEYFNIYDENNVWLGNAGTNSQCGNKTTSFFVTPAQVNNWLSDGVANFRAVPKGTGAFACNLVCAPLVSKMTARLEYFYSNSDVPIDLNYSLDGGPSQNYPPVGQTFLTTGTHTVVYTATDCAGNSSTSSVQITVNDTQPPSVAAPANITAFTNQSNCESTVTLPFPAITENCLMSANLTLASAVMPLHFVNNPDLGLVAWDISPTLAGFIPNAVGTGVLKVRFKGDNAQLGEIFEVFDEFSNDLGPTAQGMMVGECATFFETSFQVPAGDINNWALGGGNTFFKLITNLDSTDFVSNCAPLLPNGTDGESQIQVTLEYSYAVVNYTVKNAVNQTVTSGTLTGNTTTVTLPPGNYTVMYMTTDNAGLTGSASFAVTVRDTVRPNAQCQPTLTIFANPAGGSQANYILLPAQINNLSSDNCTLSANLTFAVLPDTFNCNQAGSYSNVTLTVTDSSGNSASCITIVRVENQGSLLAYTPVCEGGILQLLQTTPVAAPNTFTFVWSGPAGFTAPDTVVNPVVTNNAMAINNGTYCVTITGATGCTSSSCVQVALAILTQTPVLTAPNGVSYCPGQNVLLSTDTYSGQNVSYQWLQDAPGMPIILGTTPVNNFTVPNLPPGTYIFYVKVFANGCNTGLSNAVMVTMHDTPPADAVPEQTLVCEGQPIPLQSLTPPTGGLTYMWTGPNSFNNPQQNPLVTNSAVLQDAGKYILVTKRNGCFSNPDTVMVVVKPKPAKPSISGNVNVCVGKTVTLVSSAASGSQWVWTSPSLIDTDTITNVNSLNILNVDESDQGNWTVLITANGCSSDVSDPIHVEVQGYPALMASSNAPICKDSLLKLMATFTSPPPDPIASWCWTPPVGNPICNFQNPVIPNGASGLYQVIGATSFGCADTATVTVNNVTPPSITFIGNNAPVCCNSTTAITLSANVVPLPQNYSWTGPAFGMAAIDMATPIIGPDNNCTTLNGQYTLVVKDSFGCPSLPASTGINMQEPPITPTLTVNDSMVCAGDSVFLSFSNPSPGAVYTWNLPGGGTTTTSVPFLILTNAQPIQSGLYSVFTTSANGTCSSGVSTPVNIAIFPIPPLPTISSNSPVCEGGVLTLFGDTGGFTGVTYHWTGPAAFIDILHQNPVRQPVETNMEGLYKLTVTKDGCTSPEASRYVDVVETPQTPEIDIPIPDRVCIDGPVTAYLNITNWVNGMIYTWEDAASGIDLQSSTATSLFLGMPNVLALGPGAHTFQVFATTSVLPGCNSALSSIRTVTFDIIPFGINAYAGLDHYACVDSPIVLIATSPTGNVTGMWSQIPDPPTVTIDNANSPNATFVGSAGTIYKMQWSLSNGACMDYDQDTVEITAQNPEPPNGGPNISSCETTGIQLHAIQGTTALGMWTQSAQQADPPFSIVIDEPANPNTTISGNLQRGQNYAFYWEIGNPGCGVNSDPVEVDIYNINPNAGSNQFICNDNPCAQLQASTLGPFEMGVWWSDDSDLKFTANSPTSAEVCGLKPGKNVIYWTINQDTCGIRSRDTLEIFYAIFPTAFDDFVTVDFGDTAHVSVLPNDLLPTQFTVAITIPPVTGSILGEPVTGVYIYRPQSGFSGTEVMTYRICNTQCPDAACSFATVTFQVGDAADCFIPTIITPNEDGFNDQ